MRHALIGAVALCAVLQLLIPVGSVHAQGTARAASAPAAAPPPVEGVVNVNVATAQQLELLPGVGPARAKAIVEYRKAEGPFERLEGLLKVSGIGPRALERLRPFVVLEGKTTAVPRGR